MGFMGGASFSSCHVENFLDFLHGLGEDKRDGSEKMSESF